MLVDQTTTLLRHQLSDGYQPSAFDGEPRFSLVTVNFSTTYYFKLMLLTLVEQQDLELLTDIVVVDNDNRDGGREFLRTLERRLAKLHLVENRFFPSHARGMRIAIDWLAKDDAHRSAEQRSNVFLFCDTDVVFRREDTLRALASRFTESKIGFAGEMREGLYPLPEAQASFIAVRRDIYHRPDVVPMLHHGAPAYPLQCSLRRANIDLADFPSNFGGYILHRGRSGVAATRTYRRHDAHATAVTYRPHFMGVPGGRQVWESIEKKHQALLDPRAEPELVEYLAAALS